MISWPRATSDLQRDVVLAHARLEGDIHRRLDLDGIREIHGAAPHRVGATAQKDLAPFANREPPRDRRFGRRADDPQVDAHVECAVVVVDDDVTGRRDRDVEAETIQEPDGCRICRRNHFRSSRQQLLGQPDDLPVVSLHDRHGPAERRLLAGRRQLEIGVEFRPQTVDRLQRNSAAGERHRSAGEREPVVGERSRSGDLAAVGAGRQSAEFEATGGHGDQSRDVRDRQSRLANGETPA